MTIDEFIDMHRNEIDMVIYSSVSDLDDEERKMWVLNDRYLYELARSKGVDI